MSRSPQLQSSKKTACAAPCWSWTSHRGIQHWGKAHWWDPSAQRVCCKIFNIRHLKEAVLGVTQGCCARWHSGMSWSLWGAWVTHVYLPYYLPQRARPCGLTWDQGRGRFCWTLGFQRSHHIPGGVWAWSSLTRVQARRKGFLRCMCNILNSLPFCTDFCYLF